MARSGDWAGSAANSRRYPVAMHIPDEHLEVILEALEKLAALRKVQMRDDRPALAAIAALTKKRPEREKSLAATKKKRA